MNKAWRGFLDAVRESPEDDLNRLAWADWCEDHQHDARAAFVRAQVRFAQLADGPERDALEDEADDLLSTYEHVWLAGFHDFASDWYWERGMLEGITLYASRAREAESLLADFPIRHLRLLGNEQSYTDLAGWDYLRHIQSLDLGRYDPERPGVSLPSYRDSAFAALLTSPLLSRLRQVRLSGHEITGPTVTRLIDHHWHRLHELDVTHCTSFGDRATRMLVDQPAPHLRHLAMASTNASDLGIRTALAAPQWPELRQLHVSLSALFRRGVSPDAFRENLLEAANLPRVGVLDFSHRSVDVALLSQLVRCSRLGPIEQLHLHDCHLGTAELRVLAEWPGLANVHLLNLSNNGFSDAGLNELLASPYLSGLRHLHLGYNRCGGASLGRLYQTPSLSRLRTLHLAGNFVGLAGLKLLAESPLRPVGLSLASCSLTAAAGDLLSSSPAFERLRVLYLERNRLSDSGLRRLANGPCLRRLRTLILDANDLDSPSLEVLVDRAAWPALRTLGIALNHFSLVEKAILRERFGSGLIG
jgi:uncharacterized protein (TIGR02996 family)